MENNIQKAMKKDLRDIQKTFCVMLERAGRDVGETSEYWDIKLEEYIKQVQRNLLKAIEVEIKGFTELPVELAQTTLGYYRAIRDVLKIIKESIKGKLEL